MMGHGLQEWIHKMEEGVGTRYLKMFALILGLLGVGVFFNVREFRAFSSPEAMDAAQLARSISEGHGYQTKFVRPLSIAALQEKTPNVPLLRGGHPELNSPPVYPYLLAGLMKVLPFNFEIRSGATFMRHQPELLIAVFNQGLFFILIFMVYRLGRRMFEPAVGVVAAVALGLTELMWEFSISGLPTLLMMILLTGLCWALLAIEEAVRNETPETPASGGKLMAMAGLAGLICAAGALTRYSFGWVVVPAAVFLAVAGGTRRVRLTAVAVGVFVLAMSPWLARNYTVSGHLFGMAGYDMYKESTVFPDARLDRMLPANVQTEINRVPTEHFTRKLVLNGTELLQNELPKFGGSWLSAFFLAGLLVQFRNPGLSRLRYFILGTLALYFVAQALGRTHFSKLSPVVNGENLVVLLTPMVFLFSVAFFFILLDQIQFPAPAARVAVMVGFVVICSMPLIFRFLPPRVIPVAYPPYYPPAIQEVSSWMKEEELMMSDMPWAVAWYGGRQCAWTTMDYGNATPSDFFQINDFHKPVQALYLTPLTMDSRFLTDMLKSPDGIWCRFVLESILKTNVPPGFPLKNAPLGLTPDQLFLSDYVRWKK